MRDIEVIGDHIEHFDPPAASRIVATIFERIDRLVEFPRIGRPGRVEGTRELVAVGTFYLVAYRLRDDDIEILAVLHGARRWPESFD